MPRGCQSLRRKRFPIKHLDKKSRNFNLRSPALAHPGAPRRHKPEWTAGAGPCPRLPHLPAHCRWHTDLHCASARWLGHCAVHYLPRTLLPPPYPPYVCYRRRLFPYDATAGGPPSSAFPPAPEIARAHFACHPVMHGFDFRATPESGLVPSTRRLNVGSCCKIGEGQPSLQGLSLLTFTKRLEAGLIFSVAANLDGHDLPKTSLGLHR